MPIDDEFIHFHISSTLWADLFYSVITIILSFKRRLSGFVVNVGFEHFSVN